MKRKIDFFNLLEAYFCPICNNPSSAEICLNCQKELFNPPAHCLSCSKLLSKNNSLCAKCVKKKPALDKLAVCFDYKGIARDLVLAAKYGRNRLALKFMANKIYEVFIKKFALQKPDLIIPIPLTSQRLEERGFNQSHFLAENLGQFSKIEKGILLKDNLNPQSSIEEAAERKKNILGAFSIINNAENKIRNKKILLIDDVSTTGSTLNEAAKILKINGADMVFGLVFAATFYQ